MSIVLLVAAGSAWAGVTAPGRPWGAPNAAIGISAGAVTVEPIEPRVGVRGEGWLGDEVAIEVGATTDVNVSTLLADLALRWRPDALCIRCESRTLLTLGVGAGGWLAPELDGAGPWRWAAGPDVGALWVHWIDPSHGLSLAVRVGGGASGAGDPRTAELSAAGWAFAAAGLAF